MSCSGDIQRRFAKCSWRLHFAGGGHRRASVLRIATQVAAARPELVNDPADTTWAVDVEERPGTVRLLLVPRRLDDPRFAWRLRDVPAASHPTIAAALVRVAGVRADDIVWDPFVGSAVELVERALAGPWAELHGSDRDPEALENHYVPMRGKAVPSILTFFAQAVKSRVLSV